MTSINDYTGTPEQILSAKRVVEERKEMCRELERDIAEKKRKLAEEKMKGKKKNV